MVRRWLGFGASAASVGALVFVATVGSIASQGCTIVVSDGPLDGGTFDGDIDAAPGPVDNACNECLFQQCSGNWAVCQNQAECSTIYSCAITCKAGDQACVNACFCNHPAGQNAYVALAACDSYFSCGTCSTQCTPAAASCTAPGVIVRDICGGTVVDAGPAPDATPPDDASPPPADAALPPTDAAVVQDCTSCVNGKCSSERQQCAPKSECEGFTLCVAPCTDAACVNDCDAAHPTGKTASQALDACTTTNCKDACGL